MRRFFTLCALAALLLAGCKKNTDEGPRPDPVLEITETPIVAGAAAGDYSIRVQANGLWMAKVEYEKAPESRWIDFESTGDGNATLIVKVKANSTIEVRGATIVVEMEHLRRTVSLTQAAGEPTLSISPTELTVAAAGKRETITVVSNTEWEAKVTGESDFVTVFRIKESEEGEEGEEGGGEGAEETEGEEEEDAKGVGNGTFYIEVAANTTFESREATVTVTAEGVAPLTITVTQDADVQRVAFSGTAPAPVEAVGGEVTVTVAANVAWRISASEEFVAFDVASGSGDGTVKVLVAANDTTAERTATLTLEATEVEGVTPATLTIRQKGVVADEEGEGENEGGE